VISKQTVSEEGNMESAHIDNYLHLISGQRFKLWGITGRDTVKRDKIVAYLQTQGWTVVNVGEELQSLIGEPDAEGKISHDIGQKIKEWFHSKPDRLILVNSAILYHKSFLKISPIGAFKYNTRNKNCVIFLEEEKQMGPRLYYGKVGTEEYYDQHIHDVLITEIREIPEIFTPLAEETQPFTAKEKLHKDAIAHLFAYTVIKDVVDIDADLRERESRRELVSSFIISESLERQITDFFDNLEKPRHKAVKIIGNYGSGKSHLIAFLVSAVSDPQLRDLIRNQPVRQSAMHLSRNYFTVQFELQPVEIQMSAWFYGEITKQMKEKYDITIPEITPEQYNHKENIIRMVETVKSHDPSAGLLVILDEVSDFISQKEPHLIERDFQFLRIIGQVCQDQDIMVVISMQEDIYSSPRFKTVAAQESRVSERFQNIIIHRESAKKVIAERIVPKSANQKTELENRLREFAEKIEDVRLRMEEYVNLFPFTPLLLHLFHELPYFEKRGVIQFAQTELRYVLHKPFPFFFTFDRIFELVETNPNHRNIEEIYNLVRVVGLIRQKIAVTVEPKYQGDAIRLINGLAVYALWSRGKNGATAKELAENLLIMPQSKIFSPADYVSSIIQKIRKATDGFYLKIVKDASAANDYFRLDPAIDGKDPDEHIETAVNAISEYEMETEFFDQIKAMLELRSFENHADVFEDECPWASVKSFRRGYMIFARKGTRFSALPPREYAIALLSPWRRDEMPKLCEHQLDIQIFIDNEDKIEALRRIAAIRQLIQRNILVSAMKNKLAELTDGIRKAGEDRPGIKARMARWFYALSRMQINGESVQMQKTVREKNNLYELMYELKTAVFDRKFNETCNAHPVYSQFLSSVNIVRTLSDIALELTAGDFSRLKLAHQHFLRNLSLLNSQNDPDISQSRIAIGVLNIICSKKERVTDIEKEIVAELAKPPYGMEREVIWLMLILLTVMGRISLRAKGGDTIDIRNIREKFKNLSQFDSITYAIASDELSYDFAQRLLNTLGLNGAKIMQDKTRSSAFKEYREKVAELVSEAADIQRMAEKIREKKQSFLSSEDVMTAFEKTQVTDWNLLQITNHAGFASLEHLNSQLAEIKAALAMQKNIRDALIQYHESVYDGLEYMRQALEILDAGSPLYLTDPGLKKRLQTLFDDTLGIVRDAARFLDPSERLPVRGKIQAFKSAYVKDFYFPVHEKTVGKKVEWKILENMEKHDLVKKMKNLLQINCLVKTKFDSCMARWQKILRLRCMHADADKLCVTPFCTYCSFMKTDENYLQIRKEIDSSEQVLEELCTEYSARVCAEIRKNIAHLELIDCPEKQKIAIQKIADTQKLPEKIGQDLIGSMNQLFKNFVVVELKKQDIIRDMLREDELMTLEQLRRAFFDLEAQIKKRGHEDEIRIRFV